ncbi:hypothetical protein AU106_gp065 [Sinorhizobium phage phiM9]|uniref:Uncharacterized protein n=1 Tax=Sinorhizobium phage phiM9 TaxID=1636182 RepID=A0A0F6TH51_9CAUD|nr:hypothetical protein AU106_gp065 [Sinorhizobium phage phiM9]AKE44696.1 hypothetical protein Sm_phiM9_066 [Sinorhizobium phage phiM9]
MNSALVGKAEWHEIIAAPGNGTKFAGTQQNPNAYGKAGVSILLCS